MLYNILYIVFQALFGFIFYKESVSMMWYMGTSLILIGLFTISHGGTELVQTDDDKVD